MTNAEIFNHPMLWSHIHEKMTLRINLSIHSGTNLIGKSFTVGGYRITNSAVHWCIAIRLCGSRTHIYRKICFRYAAQMTAPTLSPNWQHIDKYGIGYHKNGIRRPWKNCAFDLPREKLSKVYICYDWYYGVHINGCVIRHGSMRSHLVQKHANFMCTGAIEVAQFHESIELRSPLRLYGRKMTLWWVPHPCTAQSESTSDTKCISSLLRTPMARHGWHVCSFHLRLNQPSH